MAGEITRVIIKRAATATYGEFNDAIDFEPAVYAAMTPAQRTAATDARYTAWTRHIDAQNAINRDPAVIAQREAEAVAHTAEMVSHVTMQPSFDSMLTAIIAAVRTGATTPADVRARLLNPVLMPINPTPIVTPTNTTPTMPGGMGRP